MLTLGEQQMKNCKAAFFRNNYTNLQRRIWPIAYRGLNDSSASTADARRDDTTRCIDAGLDGNLPKPVNANCLVETVATKTTARF